MYTHTHTCTRTHTQTHTQSSNTQGTKLSRWVHLNKMLLKMEAFSRTSQYINLHTMMHKGT